MVDEGRSETIEARGHRRVRGEKVPRSRNSQGYFKRPSGFLHEIAGAFQHGEGRMTFIEVTNFRLDSEGTKQPPPADPQHQFLLQSQLRSAPVQLAGNPAMRRIIRHIIAIQQVQLHATNLDLPGTQPHRVTG